ncbi:MAG: hypothetical protein N2645_05675 [Clostridia bacterium]|nr:hypothetical protein [Clostridia bacterium]
MLIGFNWWTCPRCKSYKVISNPSCTCIRCSFCGTYFDTKDNELSEEIVRETPQYRDNCELS